MTRATDSDRLIGFTEPAQHFQSQALPVCSCLALICALVTFLTYPPGVAVALTIGLTLLGLLSLTILFAFRHRVNRRWHLDAIGMAVFLGAVFTLSIPTGHQRGVAASLMAVTVIGGLTFATDRVYCVAVILGISIVCLFHWAKRIMFDTSESVIIFLIIPSAAILLRYAYHRQRRLALENLSLREANELISDQSQKDLKIEEERRRQSVIQLHRAQKSESIELLAGGMANRFNNSLLAIMSFAELIANTSREAAIRNEAGRIREIAFNTSRICEQMLSYAGSNNGERTSIALRGFVSSIESLMNGAITNDVQLVVHHNEKPAFVYANPGQLQQAIVNIAINALEAAEHGKGSIHIGAKRLDYHAGNSDAAPTVSVGKPLTTGEYAQITISDDGCGMDILTAAQMFDPYFSTKPARNGFGLSVSQDIVTSYGGTIEVRTTKGSGTRVDVVLPLAADEFEPGMTKAESAKSPGTLLIVDDEAIVLESVAKMASSSGWHVVKATNGLEAIQLIEEGRHSYSAILLDFSMPGMNGGEVLQILRETGCHTPVILCSGLPDNAALQSDKAIQPDAYLGKPYQFKTLQTTLASVVPAFDAMDGPEL